MPHLVCQCLCHCQLFASVSVFLNYTILSFYVRYRMAMSIFGEIILYIISKWRHSDVFTISFSEKRMILYPPISALTLIHWRKCTDTDWCSPLCCFLCISSFCGTWLGWNQALFHSFVCKHGMVVLEKSTLPARLVATVSISRCKSGGNLTELMFSLTSHNTKSCTALSLTAFTTDLLTKSFTTLCDQVKLHRRCIARNNNVMTTSEIFSMVKILSVLLLIWETSPRVI